MSRGALLAGTAGGIVGAITVAIGVMWLFIFDTLSTEINYYVILLGLYISGVFGTLRVGGVTVSFPYPIPYFPSWSMFCLYSLMLAVFLIITAVLIGAGFYGTYKIRGGAASVVGFISSVGGITAGALLIMMVNLSTGYELADLTVGGGDVGGSIPFFPVPTPNFTLIGVGFIILGVTFVVLGSASVSMRGMIEKPSASLAAGIMSIIGAIAFIIGGLMGIIANYIIVAIIGFGLVLVAFILWALIFIISEGKT